MSQIIGPPKDVALFNAAILLKEMFAHIQSSAGPTPKGLRKKVACVHAEIMQAIMSDALPQSESEKYDAHTRKIDEASKRP